jgi:hypothetical protein
VFERDGPVSTGPTVLAAGPCRSGVLFLQARCRRGCSSSSSRCQPFLHRRPPDEWSHQARVVTPNWIDESEIEDQKGHRVGDCQCLYRYDPGCTGGNTAISPLSNARCSGDAEARQLRPRVGRSCPPASRAHRPPRRCRGRAPGETAPVLDDCGAFSVSGSRRMAAVVAARAPSARWSLGRASLVRPSPRCVRLAMGPRSTARKGHAPARARQPP